MFLLQNFTVEFFSLSLFPENGTSQKHQTSMEAKKGPKNLKLVIRKSTISRLDKAIEPQDWIHHLGTTSWKTLQHTKGSFHQLTAKKSTFMRTAFAETKEQIKETITCQKKKLNSAKDWNNHKKHKKDKNKENPQFHFDQRTQCTYLALGGLLGTSGSNSTGKPKNPLNLSKVTWATWRTLVGQPISMLAQSSLRSLLQATRDFLKSATRRASKEIWSLWFFSLCFTNSSSSSSMPSCVKGDCGGIQVTEEEEEEEEVGEGEEGKCEGEWRTSVMAGKERSNLFFLEILIKNKKRKCFSRFFKSFL